MLALMTALSTASGGDDSLADSMIIYLPVVFNVAVPAVLHLVVKAWMGGFRHHPSPPAKRRRKARRAPARRVR